VKLETYAISRKIAKPVERRVTQSEPDHFTSDCPMAGNHIAHGLDEKPTNEHPLSLLRKAYGI
jgi:glycerol-3-phosphate dehydrogenase subunit C